MSKVLFNTTTSEVVDDDGRTALLPDTSANYGSIQDSITTATTQTTIPVSSASIHGYSHLLLRNRTSNTGESSKRRQFPKDLSGMRNNAKLDIR